MIRALNKMTAYGALKPLSKEVEIVGKRLLNLEDIKKARLHPFTILVGLSAYQNGRSQMGYARRGEGLTWEPIPQIIDALDSAFYLAFDAVEPTGKRILIGLDVSGSMGTLFMNSPLSVREATAALSLVTARTEKNYHIMGFSREFIPLNITAKSTLKSAVKAISGLPFSSTDCSLPMRYALERGLEVDAFLVMTDNETWAGNIHPSKALQDYRRKTGIPAKLIVAGMTSTEFSIADPEDAGMRG
jgi:60 kDa SS-A/Ro ribonucleoprotein